MPFEVNPNSCHSSHPGTCAWHSATCWATCSATQMTLKFRRARGFTLIELMAAVSVAGVLTSIALPSFEAQLQRARRSDALVTMMQLQGAQERWRSNGASYGSLTDIGGSPASPAGHYTLQVVSADAEGYEMMATANGAQARDAGCRHLALRMLGTNPVYASGPDATVANPAPANAKCWSL